LWSPFPVGLTKVFAFNCATVEEMKICNDKGKAILVQAYYRSKVFQDVDTVRFQDSPHTGGNFFSPRHRFPVPSRKYTWYSFPLEA